MRVYVFINNWKTKGQWTNVRKINKPLIKSLWKAILLCLGGSPEGKRILSFFFFNGGEGEMIWEINWTELQITARKIPLNYRKCRNEGKKGSGSRYWQTGELEETLHSRQYFIAVLQLTARLGEGVCDLPKVIAGARVGPQARPSLFCSIPHCIQPTSGPAKQTELSFIFPVINAGSICISKENICVSLKWILRPIEYTN